MDKNEFLTELRQSLDGEIPPYAIDGHVRYYEDYLSNNYDEKSELDKLRELGDPRLIARTIVDTSNIKIDPIQRKNQNDAYNQYEEKEEESSTPPYGNLHIRSFSWDSLTWFQKVLAVIIGVLIVAVVLGIVIVGVNLFFSIVLPVLVVLFIVRLVISFSKK